MYLSGVIVAFVIGFMMLYSSRIRRLRQEGQTPAMSRAALDAFVGAAIGATLSWLMVAVCLVMLFFSKTEV